MSFVNTSTLKNSTIMLLYSEKDTINLEPEYQRMGGIWTPEKRKLLIDSILNDYDIPKIYFHLLSNDDYKDSGFKYSVIDGRQRLETIFDFVEGKFALDDGFEYQREPELKLAGLSYKDLAAQYPKIRIKFDSFVLPIVTVSIDGNDIDLIEDMFSRLNEAVPLNAAEKRNAIGGELVRAIAALSIEPFFSRNVRFSNRRYQHRESVARFLLIEDSLSLHRKLIDTKKVYLDDLARRYSNDRGRALALSGAVNEVISLMSNIFIPRDELLQAQGTLVIYYLIVKMAEISNEIEKVTRRKLLDFRDTLKNNRDIAENDYTNSSYDLLEYDRLSQQGTNDASSIKERYSILAEFLDLTVKEIGNA